ncbi:MAG: anaerobic ribonucleoside-triphosphate reductase activating protein [Clostridia bacterium]|nr:anaerobic ribonucleoside-triphosphate reductase activating protein [Clostridia bacterium]
MKDTVRIAGIIRESIVDGPGFRFVVFSQGCAHGCYKCQNPESWDFSGGYDCDISKILKAIDENPLLDGVTFSGGDPVYQAEAFYDLATEIKKRKLSVMLYTGFTFEELIERSREDEYVMKLLMNTDLLCDGLYMDELRDLTLLFRGSKNQRIIDVQKSLKEGRAVLDERYNNEGEKL